MASHVAFPLIGLASIAVGWPLSRRRIPPNRWYGFRVPATLADPEAWYEVNETCGDDLVRLGVVLLTVAVGLLFVPDLPELAYVVICLAVFLTGSVRAIVRAARAVRDS